LRSSVVTLGIVEPAGSRTNRKIGRAKTPNRIAATRKIGSGDSVIPRSSNRTPDEIVPKYPIPTPMPDSLPRVSG
jgi:hypothetical protein